MYCFSCTKHGTLQKHCANYSTDYHYLTSRHHPFRITFRSLIRSLRTRSLSVIKDFRGRRKWCMRVCHKSMTHPFSQKAPTCKLLSCSLRKFSVLFTTKPKLSQARALSFCKKVVSLQKTFIEYGKDTNKIRN